MTSMSTAALLRKAPFGNKLNNLTWNIQQVLVYTNHNYSEDIKIGRVDRYKN
jgi:hypothetical protein